MNNLTLMLNRGKSETVIINAFQTRRINSDRVNVEFAMLSIIWKVYPEMITYKLIGWFKYKSTKTKHVLFKI